MKKQLAFGLLAAALLSSAALADQEVKQKDGNNTQMGPGGTLTVTAPCSAGKFTSGGGYHFTGGAPGASIITIENQPDGPDGINPIGWKVTLLNASPTGSPNAAVFLNVYAICR